MSCGLLDTLVGTCRNLVAIYQAAVDTPVGTCRNLVAISQAAQVTYKWTVILELKLCNRYCSPHMIATYLFDKTQQVCYAVLLFITEQGCKCRVMFCAQKNEH